MIYKQCQLTDQQFTDALRIAERIYRTGRRFGRRPRYGQDAAVLPTQNQDGTLACKAFAVMEGLPYNPGVAPEWRVGDYWIRSTARERGCLLLHPDDDSKEQFVLLIGYGHTWGIAGWCYGADGQCPRYWRTDTGRPAFFVPQRALRAWPPVAVQLELLAR